MLHNWQIWAAIGTLAAIAALLIYAAWRNPEAFKVDEDDEGGGGDFVAY
jgi:hypothetical protein